MKSTFTRVGLAGAVLALSGIGVLAEKIPFNELPRAAQKTVRAQAGSAQIEDIDKNARQGEVVYEVAFKRDGEHIELKVGPDGTILNPAVALNERQAAPAATAAPRSRSEMARLPKPVQQTIGEQAGRVSVKDVETYSAEIYEVAALEPAGLKMLRITEDGTVLTDNRTTRIIPEADVQLAGAAKTTLRMAPPEVQRTVWAYTKGAQPVEDLDKGTVNGVTVYQAAFKRNGQHTELLVTEDGLVLNGNALEHLRSDRHKLINLELHQAPRAVLEAIRDEVGNAEIQQMKKRILPAYAVHFPEGRKVSEIRILEDGTFYIPAQAARTSQRTAAAAPEQREQALEFRDLPDAVQNAAIERVGSAAIESIRREVVDGRPVYSVWYKRDGDNVGVMINEEGSIVRTIQGFRSHRFIVPLLSETRVGFHQLPRPVQQTIRKEAGSSEIEELSKGVWRDQLVYQAAFDRDGHRMQIQVDPDGSLLRASAGAER